jgi:hypothetical protein
MYGEVLASYEAIFDYMEKFMYLMNLGKEPTKEVMQSPNCRHTQRDILGW